MCIDFYGRSYAEELTSPVGKPRVVWIAPQGGTTLSADPVGVLKGAPHRGGGAGVSSSSASAREAQMLWFGKPGTPHGPQERALHRTPIRRDLYTPENLANSTMPGIRPYEDPGNFTYQRELTGASFNTLRQLVKVMCIDSHEEMKSAWLALRDAGMPADALAVFSGCLDHALRRSAARAIPASMAAMPCKPPPTPPASANGSAPTTARPKPWRGEIVAVVCDRRSLSCMSLTPHNHRISATVTDRRYITDATVSDRRYKPP